MQFPAQLLLPARERSALFRGSILILALGTTTLIVDQVAWWIGPDTALAVFLPAVFLATWFGGAKVGAAAAVTAAAAGLLGSGLDPLAFTSGTTLGRLLLFGANSAIVIALTTVLQRSRGTRLPGRAAAQHFEIMADNAPVLIWSTDAENRCIFVNRPWRTFTGAALGNPPGPRPGQIHPADVARYESASAQHIAAREPFLIEYRLRRADGSYRWLLEQAVPRFDASARFEGYLGSCNDITDSHQEREELALVSRLQGALAESLDLDKCAELLVQAFVPRIADWCGLDLVDDAGRLERLRVHHFEIANASGRFDPATPASPAAEVVRTGQTQLRPGADLAVRRAIAVDAAHFERLSAATAADYLGVPLRARGRIIGVLALATAESGRRLGEAEVRLAEKIAGIAGFALENARLYRSVRQALAAEEQARREMELSERRFRFIWEANIFGMCTISRAGRILNANQALTDLLVFSPDEIAAGRVSLNERTAPDWRAADERANEELQRTGRCAPFEKEYLRPDGSRVQALVCGSLLPDSEECMAFVLDLSAQKHAERALDRQRLLLKTIIDAMPAMVAYLGPDERFWLHNEKYQQWLGVDNESIHGHTMRELVGPEAHERMAPYLRAALRGRNMRHETTLRSADRERHLIASYRPHHDADGRVCGVVVHAYDITERKETEQALAEALTRYRFLADAMPQMVWTALPHGQIDYVNRRWLETTGMTEAAALGPDGWLDAVHFEDRPLTRERWREAVAQCLPFEHECRLRCGRNVTWRWHLVRALPRRDDQGVVVQWVGSATDMDEQRRAYAELAEARARLKSHADELEARVRARTATLREANAELEAFTYSVSHDLRTPLQFVRGFAEAIHSDTAANLSTENRDHLQRIIRAASRMDTIIQDLLSYSRLARADVQLISLSLEDVVNDVLIHQHAAIRQSGATVVVERPLPQVAADRTGLFQALSNLVSNALKFTRAGTAPVVRIRVEAAGAGPRLWVEDNGIGIDPRHHERIFQLFERLHSQADYPGTGIGLSLVRKAVSRMGGTCGVESAPEAGSRFWIEFPVRSDAPAPSLASHVTA